MQWLGLDIGGANVKAADGQGFASSHPFPLWKQPQKLAQQLRTVIAQSPPCDHLAITMTGELADCFKSKAEGVQFILESVQQACDARHTRVYLSTGTLVTPQVAMTRVLDVAAANWHALARFACRYVPKHEALLIDVGTTTCDIVPLANGSVATTHTQDTQRLLAGELVYCGIERTPVCALVESVPYRGQKCPVAREFFATTQDVYLLLGDLPEEPSSRLTADGRPATKAGSRDRLGRVICGDETNFNHKDALIMANAIAEAQAIVVARSIDKVVNGMQRPPQCVIISGQGEFLLRRALERLQWKPRLVSLASELGPQVSRCGPAHALAVLAREATGGA